MSSTKKKTQIDIVNHYINDTNWVLHSHTPHFSEDLVHSKRNSRYLLRTKYKYKFTLYTDGIHPKPLLAKLWLARICRLVHDLCYWILLTLTFGWHAVNCCSLPVGIECYSPHLSFVCQYWLLCGYLRASN